MKTSLPASWGWTARARTAPCQSLFQPAGVLCQRPVFPPSREGVDRPLWGRHLGEGPAAVGALVEALAHGGHVKGLPLEDHGRHARLGKPFRGGGLEGFPAVFAYEVAVGGLEGEVEAP